MSSWQIRFLWVLSLVWLTAAMRASALILFGTDDPQRNIVPPVGELADSGWRTQTDGFFCATAIGPRHAVTAAHLNVVTGGETRFGGLTYPATSFATAPGTDLRLLEFAGRLPAYAAPYTGTNETGQTLVLHGRGTLRGGPVFADGADGPEHRGWLWGGADGRLRWGTNVVALAYTAQPEDGVGGELLLAQFHRDGGDDLVTFSGGDSGGGAFLRDDDGQWKLAGVNYAVEGPFNTTTNGPGFFAALFNRRGYLEQDLARNWLPIEDEAEHPETLLFMTRISSYAGWLAEQLAKPPAVAWPRLCSAPAAAGPYEEHPAYAVDVTKRQITLLVPDGPDRFFGLDGAATLRGPLRQGGLLVFTYE